MVSGPSASPVNEAKSIAKSVRKYGANSRYVRTVHDWDIYPREREKGRMDGWREGKSGRQTGIETEREIITVISFSIPPQLSDLRLSCSGPVNLFLFLSLSLFLTSIELH